MSRSGVCPSCGSPIAFEVGSSRAAVCRFCNTLVVRSGQDFASIGKVADLVPTGTRVAIGATGRYLGERFTVVGRVQLEWTQGVWDEWYVSFPDERWGWLAEAGGHYYLTFEVPDDRLPARDAIAPGQAITLERHGRFVVTDLKDARVVSAAGELPEEVPLGGSVHSADLEGTGGAFATIDYGAPGDEAALFLGKEVQLADLDLHAGAAAALPEPGPEGEAIVCKNCGAPVTIRVPGQTVHLVCGSCNALLSLKEGAGRVVAVLDRQRDEPPIPIGTKGTLRGAEVMVVGWMRRGCHVDHVHYPWDELLLYAPKTTALTWLVLAEGHWSLARSVSAGEVVSVGNEAFYKDKRFRRFSAVLGQVEAVLGEFPWTVQVGELAQLEDFVAPPDGLSAERTGDELHWSLVDHLEPEEVAKAFGRSDLARDLRRRPGPFQPWPYARLLKAIQPWMIAGVLATIVLWIGFASRDQQVRVQHFFAGDDAPSVEPAAEGGEAPPTRLRSFVSEPFELTGHQALEVHVRSDVDNHWAWIEGALIREDTGDAAFFGLETAYYHGYDGGESWSEGSNTASETLASPARGTYVLRADCQWDPTMASAPSVTIQLREGNWSGGQVLAVLALLLSPLLLFLHRRGFEKRRWDDSNLAG